MNRSKTVAKLGQFTEEFILQEAQRQYEENLATINIDPKDTALLVIDMLDEFVKPNWAPWRIPEATRQVPAIRSVVNAFRDAEAPVVFVGYETSMRGKNFPDWGSVPVGAGFDAYKDDMLKTCAFYEGLRPQDGDYTVLKHSYSGFHGTILENLLRNIGAKTVVICGTMTNYCCGATAREAFWRGFNVVFGSDTNSTDDPRQQEAELRTLRRGYARIMDSKSIINAISGQS